jgi:hypothetical protein
MRTSDIKQELDILGVPVECGSLPEYIRAMLGNIDGLCTPVRPKGKAHPANLMVTEDSIRDENLSEECRCYFYFAVENVEDELRGQYVWIIGDTLRVAGLRRSDNGWSVEISRTDTECIRNMGVRRVDIASYDLQIGAAAEVF